ERAGNVMTTVVVFLVAATVLYVARESFFVLVLALLFAYLLEPAVDFVQRHSLLGWVNRNSAIAQVYLAGLIVAVIFRYSFGSRFVAQVKGLNTALPQILQNLDEKSATNFEAQHGVSPATQQKIHDWLARNHDSLVSAFERNATSTAVVAGS